MGVEIIIEGLDDAINAALQERIDAALSVVDEVPAIIKDQAALENEDVDGQQFPQKQPRPKNNPTNNPDRACIDTGNMFDNDNDNDRWKSETVSATQRDCVYSPPDYYQYLVEKDPANGGRKWLLKTQINDTAAKKIQDRMIEKAGGGQ